MTMRPQSGDRTSVLDVPGAEWHARVLAAADGARFAGLYGDEGPGAGVRLNAVFADGPEFRCVRTVLEPGTPGDAPAYRSLTPEIPAAVWYERVLHDLHGVRATGHPRLDPLVVPPPADRAGRPGADAPHGPVDVEGEGMFTLPLGPVRSGVYEAIEFLLETPGEDIPHLNIRPYHKHRGVAERFRGATAADGVVVAERVEGIASVAHALAFSHAIEDLTGTGVPDAAGLIRVVHAELERIANHLDVVIRLCEAAGLAVAFTRFGWHKEEVMRLTSALCGNRFGRSTVVPGGVAAAPALAPRAIAGGLATIADRIRSDRDALMTNASFLDRVRGTGVLDPAVARRYGALGPVGRGSGVSEDVRELRPYDGYRQLHTPRTALEADGDCLARLQVRWAEIDTAAALIEASCRSLHELGDAAPLAAEVPADAVDGYAIGSAEAPQGEVLYCVRADGGRVGACFARSASFHDMVLFHEVFNGDVFTDFAFIEASFGLSYAGVAM